MKVLTSFFKSYKLNLNRQRLMLKGLLRLLKTRIKGSHNNLLPKTT